MVAVWRRVHGAHLTFRCPKLPGYCHANARNGIPVAEAAKPRLTPLTAGPSGVDVGTPPFARNAYKKSLQCGRVHGIFTHRYTQCVNHWSIGSGSTGGTHRCLHAGGKKSTRARARKTKLTGATRSAYNTFVARDAGIQPWCTCNTTRTRLVTHLPCGAPVASGLTCDGGVCTRWAGNHAGVPRWTVEPNSTRDTVDKSPLLDYNGTAGSTY